MLFRKSAPPLVEKLSTLFGGMGESYYIRHNSIVSFSGNATALKESFLNGI